MLVAPRDLELQPRDELATDEELDEYGDGYGQLAGDVSDDANAKKLDESTYATFLAVLLYFHRNWDDLRGKPGIVISWLCSALFLLMVTIFAQVLLLYFLENGNLEQIKRFDKRLFGAENSLCWHVDQKVFGFLSNETQAVLRPAFDKGNLLSCIPDELLLINSLDVLMTPPDRLLRYQDVAKWQRKYVDTTKRKVTIYAAFMRIGHYLYDLSGIADLKNFILAAPWFPKALSQTCSSVGGLSPCDKPWKTTTPSWVTSPPGVTTPSTTINDKFKMKYLDFDVKLWSMEVKPFMETCALLDSRLCAKKLCEKPRQRGNVSKYFKRLGYNNLPVGVRAFDFNSYPKDGLHSLASDTDPIFRDYISVCENILEVCPKMLSQTYKTWQGSREDLCGEARYTFKTSKSPYMNSTGDIIKGANEKLGIAKFETYDVFNGPKIGVKEPLFQVFRCVILIVWFASLVKDMTQRVAEVTVVCVSVCPCYSHSEIPAAISLLFFYFALLPDCIISVLALFWGTHFLLLTTSFMELMLNSVALVFIVELDNLLYAAFVSSAMKAWIGTITLRDPLLGTFEKCNKSAIVTCTHCILMVCIVALAVFLTMRNAEWTELSMRQQAEALTCLCQADGDNCVSNILWQGTDTPGSYCA